MLRTISRSNILLLTGILVQKAEPEGERSVSDRLRSASESLRNLCFGRDAKEELTSPTDREIKNDVEQGSITRWGRVRMAFRMGGTNELSPEANFAIYLSGVGGFLGFMYGGLVGYAKAFNLFMYSNDATKFLNAKEARSYLARATFDGFFKGGILTAPKFAVLCFIFGVTNGAVSVYRGKNGISDFAIAGAVTTATMKWNLGIRGMISGSVSGGLTGLLTGTIIYAFGGITGNSMKEIREILYLAHIRRKQALMENAASDLMPVEKYYKEKTKDLPTGFSD